MLSAASGARCRSRPDTFHDLTIGAIGPTTRQNALLANRRSCCKAIVAAPYLTCTDILTDG